MQCDVSVDSPSQELSVSINDSRGKLIGKKEKETSMRQVFQAEKSGSVQMCVSSQAASPVEFEFSMKTGVDSKDYANLITKDNMRPAEAQAVKVIDMVK